MNINDRSKALTAEDIIRRYNLEELIKDRKNIQTTKKSLENTNVLINEFVDATLKNINDLQDQVDGNISTWFFSGIPELGKYPSNEWETNEKKNIHLGDLYYDQDTGYAYRFALENNNYSWIKIVDSDVTKALALANSAQDTADSKRRIFVSTPSPPYDVGDIWLKEDKEIFRCRAARKEGEYKEVDWISGVDYTNDDYAKNVEAVLNQFKKDVQDNYATTVQLETTKDSIVGIVEAETTKIETNISVLENNTNNQINNNYQELNSKFDNYATTENINSLNQRVENIQTATERNINIIEDIKINGVSQVKTETGFSFNKDGLKMSKTGAKTDTNVNEAGMEIIDKTGSGNSTLQYSGYVNEEIASKNIMLEKYKSQTVNYSKNILFEQYLSSKNWRLEEVEDSEHGTGLGFFYTGGS